MENADRYSCTCLVGTIVSFGTGVGECKITGYPEKFSSLKTTMYSISASLIQIY